MKIAYHAFSNQHGTKISATTKSCAIHLTISSFPSSRPAFFRLFQMLAARTSIGFCDSGYSATRRVAPLVKRV